MRISDLSSYVCSSDLADGEVEVSLSPSKIRFALGGAVLTSKLIDGTFPDYSRVIPTANDRLLKIDSKSLANGVDRVSTIAREKTPAVNMAVAHDTEIRRESRRERV